jgi:hypothetical protein
MPEDDRPHDSIDPDSIPARLTLIEERLKAMSIELDSLKAMSIGHDSLRRTSRRRHRSTTKRSNSVVILGLAVAAMFVVGLFLLYAELAPSPNAGWAPSPTVVPPAAPSAGPSNAPEPDSHF